MAGPTIATFKIEGVEALNKQLMEFPEQVQLRAMRQMLYAGAAVVRDKARPNVYRAPKAYWQRMYDKISKAGNRRLFEPGWVAKNISIRPKKGSRYRVYQTYLRGRAWWGRFIEYGFTLHGVKHPAMPFLRPALFDNIERVTEAMKIKLSEFITKYYVSHGIDLKKRF